MPVRPAEQPVADLLVIFREVFKKKGFFPQFGELHQFEVELPSFSYPILIIVDSPQQTAEGNDLVPEFKLRRNAAGIS